MGFAACLALLLAFIHVPALHFSLPAGANLAVHTLLEVASVVVCLTVFAMGWATYEREPESVLPLVSAVFLAAALLDLVHLLSYTGMPLLVTPSGTGKAISTFLTARVLVALAMVAIAFLPARPRPLSSRRLLLAASLGVALLVSWEGLANQAVAALFFDPQAGLTALKIGIEYLIIGLHLLAIGGFAVRLSRPDPVPVAELLAANALMALSEFCFTLYSHTADQYINVGHVIKIAAYLLVWRAMFVDALLKPYRALERTRADLVVLNATLEDRVHQRTAQLETVNRELEAFSYTVAHDLRAPLGVIEGFSTVLLDRLRPRLEGRELHYLERVRAGALGMSSMIDGLLALSGIARAQLQPQAIDLAAIARAVLEECQGRDPQREVEAVIPETLPARADERLLRVLLANLLGNAWKFTARTAHARIELGVQAGGEVPVYFVRDNGAGFELPQDSELGAPFRRFHSQSEFEGHGIGLATASRVVALHGGRLWAHSRPGEGATLFFTLGSA